jgi:hypothetical protein
MRLGFGHECLFGLKDRMREGEEWVVFLDSFAEGGKEFLGYLGNYECVKVKGESVEVWKRCSKSVCPFLPC